MQRPDTIRIRHMLDAATEAVLFAEGISRPDLDTDRKTAFAIVRAVEIIGEAASRVSAECRSECSEVQWPAMVAMRNRLIHAYFDIDLDRVWETVTDDPPELVAKLEDVLGREGGE